MKLKNNMSCWKCKMGLWAGDSVHVITRARGDHELIDYYNIVKEQYICNHCYQMWNIQANKGVNNG